MAEYLNEKEKEMLVWIGKQYLEYYETEMDVPEHDFEVFGDKAVDMIQNILIALQIRGYISFSRLAFDHSVPARRIYLQEKALNLFNSDQFAEMQKG